MKGAIALAIRRIEVGRRMSQVVVHGDTVYLAGQVAREAEGQSAAAQTSDILARIDRLLSEAGTDKSKLLMINIWLADMAAFAEMNTVRDAWAVEGQTPGRATVEARLAGPQYAVEIAAVAAR